MPPSPTIPTMLASSASAPRHAPARLAILHSLLRPTLATSPRPSSSTCHRHHLSRTYSSSPTHFNATPSSQPAAPAGPPESYVSLSHDPFFNLALEGHLFRTRPSQTPVCLIYRNSPCVVLGRNQNPWKELNAIAMRAAAIPLVRRQSGGGTVYHDLGNTNYSFHVPRDHFDRSTHAELMARALNKPPVSLVASQAGIAHPRGAYVNGRGDICVAVRTARSHEDGVETETEAGAEAEAYEERKVSGSAYKLVNARAYHHGTMLLSASLSSLGASLRNSRGSALVSKGVASVPAKVTNLIDAFPDRAHALDHDTVARAAVVEFWQTYAGHRGETRLVDESVLDAPEMNEGQWKLREAYEELKSWEWVWGQTPEFTHRISLEGGPQGLGLEVEVHSKNGIILEARLERGVGGNEVVEEARRTIEALRGRRYDEIAKTPPWARDLEGTSGSKLRPKGEFEAAIFKWLHEAL
ncbi:hypothetical protein ACQY0O_007233 [Thecaphora frezii]